MSEDDVICIDWKIQRAISAQQIRFCPILPFVLKLSRLLYISRTVNPRKLILVKSSSFVKMRNSLGIREQKSLQQWLQIIQQFYGLLHIWIWLKTWFLKKFGRKNIRHRPNFGGLNFGETICWIFWFLMYSYWCLVQNFLIHA